MWLRYNCIMYPKFDSLCSWICHRMFTIGITTPINIWMSLWSDMCWSNVFIYEFHHVSEVSTIFVFILYRFAISLLLTMGLLVLDAEFDSLSNGITFNWRYRAKYGCNHQKLQFWQLFYDEILFFLPRFAIRLVLTLEVAVLDAEFNSLSTRVRYTRTHRQKKTVFPQIPDFSYQQLKTSTIFGFL